MITKIKGTQDILPEECVKWQEVEQIIRQVSRLYNFSEIRTPIFEATEIYHRGTGEGTDIVKKETYDFLDRGERQITLRPEGTPGIVRSIIENKLYTTSPLPLKLFYVGPMFRYERPQKGRQRQFHQFGAEAIGSADPMLDAEMIAYAATFLAALGLHSVLVKVNSIGDRDSQVAYAKALKDFLYPEKEHLCPDCQRRLDSNPMRVLDCKVDIDNPLLKNAPKPLDFLSEAAQAHFNSVLDYLKAMGVAHKVEPNLVRGLDYYTHTVFELEADISGMGAQSTLCGGGRYDRLSETLDGPNLPSVGFAFGLERLLIARDKINIETQAAFIHAFLIVLGEKPKARAMAIARSLRHGGIVTDMDFQDRSLKGKFKQGERLNPYFYLIFGEDELNEESIMVKQVKTGTQEKVSLDQLYRYLVDCLRAETPCSGHCENCESDC
ncbi:MAG: histidine--tRNA ligase [Candidatus Izemoplasmatales bacterium]|nr:histidine--tRNA ligase [Candidatus Izemoplasmatales bacterium]